MVTASNDYLVISPIQGTTTQHLVAQTRVRGMKGARTARTREKNRRVTVLLGLMAGRYDCANRIRVQTTPVLLIAMRYFGCRSLCTRSYMTSMATIIIFTLPTRLPNFWRNALSALIRSCTPSSTRTSSENYGCTMNACRDDANVRKDCTNDIKDVECAHLIHFLFLYRASRSGHADVLVSAKAQKDREQRCRKWSPHAGRAA